MVRAVETMNTTSSTLTGTPTGVFRRATALSSVAFALLTSAGLTQLSAQTPSPTIAAAKSEPVVLDAFVSTGTRFSDRTVTESPVPIDVVVNTELRQGGYTETSQVLQA